MVGPPITRQYRRKAHRLDVHLTRNLVWRYSAIGNVKPRLTPFRLAAPIEAHTDAQGNGHMASAHTISGWSATSLHLPVRFINPRKSQKANRQFSLTRCAPQFS